MGIVLDGLNLIDAPLTNSIHHSPSHDSYLIGFFKVVCIDAYAYNHMAMFNYCLKNCEN